MNSSGKLLIIFDSISEKRQNGQVLYTLQHKIVYTFTPDLTIKVDYFEPGSIQSFEGEFNFHHEYNLDKSYFSAVLITCTISNVKPYLSWESLLRPRVLPVYSIKYLICGNNISNFVNKFTTIVPGYRPTINLISHTLGYCTQEVRPTQETKFKHESTWMRPHTRYINSPQSHTN